MKSLAKKNEFLRNKALKDKLSIATQNLYVESQFVKIDLAEIAKSAIW